MSAPAAPTTIVLADDHQVVRHGLRVLLAAEPDFRIVGETGDGLEAVRMVEKLSPAVLVADVAMAGLSGLEVTREVARRCPKTRVVVLSMHADDAYVMQAFRNGATAYVVKDSSGEELMNAIRAAVAGRRTLSSQLSDRALSAYVERPGGPISDRYDTLTTREREILHLVAEGLTSAQISKRLFISRRTVETHRANLLRKLELKTAADLVRYTYQRAERPR